MKIYTDHYRTGKSRHKACEDYALSGDEPIPYLIVSDGCSSSPDTDIGARLVALSARNCIREIKTPDVDYHTLGHEIIHRSAAPASLLQIHRHSLDATLLIAFCIQSRIFVYVYGDGFVITQDSGGQLCIREIRFESNAPYYLSYLLNADRHNAYQQEMDKPKFINQSDGQIVTLAYHSPVFFEFKSDEMSMLMLASDGLGSFIDMQGNSVSSHEVIHEFTAFKNFKGEFVKRRAKRAVSDFERRSMVNTDDLSVAVMYFNTVKNFRS